MLRFGRSRFGQSLHYRWGKGINGASLPFPCSPSLAILGNLLRKGNGQCIFTLIPWGVQFWFQNKPDVFQFMYSLESPRAVILSNDGETLLLHLVWPILISIKMKFSDGEKGLLATVWPVEHFCSYAGGQKLIINFPPTCHPPEQAVAKRNSQIAAWMMTLHQ